MKKISFIFVVLLCVCLLTTSCTQGVTPDAKAPEAEASEAETPETETPEAEVSEAETPEAETPEAEVSEAKTFIIKTPEAEAPEIESPEAGIYSYSQGDPNTDTSSSDTIIDDILANGEIPGQDPNGEIPNQCPNDKIPDQDSTGETPGRYSNIVKLFEYWERNGYPDYVGSVFSTDGSMDNLTVLLVDDNEKIKEQILSSLFDSSGVSFGKAQFSYKELLEVNNEINEVYLGSDDKIYGSGIGWTSIDGVVTGFGINSKESRVVVSVDETVVSEYASRFYTLYGDVVVVEVGDPITFLDEASDPITSFDEAGGSITSLGEAGGSITSLDEAGANALNEPLANYA